MRQIILTITHIGSVMTYVISDAVRKPCHVLTIIWFYNPLSANTEARTSIFLLLVDILLLLPWMKY